MINKTEKQLAAEKFDRIHRQKVRSEEATLRAISRYRIRPFRTTESRKLHSDFRIPIAYSG